MATPSATFALSAWLFLRLLALIYVAAFASLGVQIRGLVGSRGILPAALFLEQARAVWGRQRFRLLPTLCWWRASDAFLGVLCWGGAGLALLLLLGVAPALVLLLLWTFYLSLLSVCRLFLAYQWDVLLLETGFLAIFLAPLELLPRWPSAAPDPIAVWLLRLLAFRLMFSSGTVKLLSRDATWRSLTALRYHYETQPLPTPLSWYAHQLPAALQRAKAASMFLIELAIPWLFFGPGPVRAGAGAATIGFMLLVMATGNYCFFNLNAIALCLLLFDDEAWRRAGNAVGWAGSATPPSLAGSSWPPWTLLPVAAVVLLLSLRPATQLLGRSMRWPRALRSVVAWLEPFHLVNPYGLFAVMTTTRPEIVVEGSDDGKTWRAFEFRWKPGDVRRAPRFCAPHQPRLDWQMWFAALGDYRSNPWFAAFLTRLLEGSPPVLSLLRTNPFPDGPPRYVRGVAWDYRFTDFRTRRATGAWWRREEAGLYCPAVTLEETAS